MADKSNIHWTDASWNPVTGCSRVSEGCRHCYAEALSLRHGWSKKPWTAPNAAENVVLHPDRLALPLRWKEPRRVFVNSMSDLFHEQVPDEYIVDVFRIMAHADHHTFQVLTKRPERMARLLSDGTLSAVADEIGGCTWPLPNVWIGTSVERQKEADERIPHLLMAPAVVRFLSCEPLLGSIDLSRWLARNAAPGPNGIFSDRLAINDRGRLHWAIVGGESGPGYRTMEVDWARDLRDQCLAADGVAFFFKQSSGFRPGMGRELDGHVWEQFPAEKRLVAA